MAKKQKQEEAPAGSPAWMATFSDLMNLLLCFFVLLFSMSSTDTEKFQEVIASIQSSFSIFSQGGTSIGEGQMISSGISQLEMFDDYFNSVHDGDDEQYEKEGASENENEGEQSEDGSATNEGDVSSNGVSVEEAQEALEQAGAGESESIAEEIESQLSEYGLQDQVEVDFNANYVMITINGALLFDSGKAVLTDDALTIVDNLSKILAQYDNNIIEVEGHTDNVPMSSGTYENNDVLSMYRALYVADRIREVTDLNPAYIKSAGRGEYVPIADNSTAEGRARNRRVEIKIYNSYSSDIAE
ncbi:MULTISPECIES: OmpA/MotB family protein [Pseudobutyrivibrio]|jgi:chemotaxis protein MotB|uniref:OmpA/MotB family protein n=1 Tax=Pseudobutyrivibrio TaxID=46205 RepID=UPI0005D13672|nr:MULTISPECIES: flagellar motor protein MotB [Pseudobutyrivibrio]MBE5914192.1 chemotaxis protein [Pseudobutyrivibrio ruminis]SES74089.1 chemotaxis protein MotB [Pseudobutyrivibrio sp. C4]SFO30915.1 chemotaxis protein MotB [Pseudobutyrivibrio sp. JW11]